jgi:hypothetical protein
VAATSSISQNGVGLGDEMGQRDRRKDQHGRAEDRPVAPAEGGDRKGVGEADQAPDEARQRHQLEELVGRVVKAGLRQLGGDDAPYQPDREAEVLGENRPDQVAPRDGLACCLPEPLVLRVPLGDPSGVAPTHQIRLRQQ